MDRICRLFVLNVIIYVRNVSWYPTIAQNVWVLLFITQSTTLAISAAYHKCIQIIRIETATIVIQIEAYYSWMEVVYTALNLTVYIAAIILSVLLANKTITYLQITNAYNVI